MVNLNAVEHDRAISYLTFRDPKECPTCGLTLHELDQDDKDNRRKKYGNICQCGWFYEGKTKNEPKFCPKCNGHRRLRPLLLVEHEDGTNKDNKNGVYGAGLRWGCYSCNRIMTHVDQEIHTEERELTREKKDYLIGKPSLINFITDRIRSSEEDHVCHDSILNAPFGRRSYSIITKKRWLKEYIYSKENERKGRFDLFDYTCSSPLCNGQHIAFHGLIPKDILEQLKLQDELEQTEKYYKRF